MKKSSQYIHSHFILLASLDLRHHKAAPSCNNATKYMLHLYWLALTERKEHTTTMENTKFEHLQELQMPRMYMVIIVSEIYNNVK